MCIAFLGTNVGHKFPLVLALNRDEDPRRPTAPLHEWDYKGYRIIAGRDLESRGTWFGWSATTKQFAVLTNRRRKSESVQQVLDNRRRTSEEINLRKNTYTSRGILVCDVLRDGLDFPLAQQDHLYRPFNLLLGSLENGLMHVSEENVGLGGTLLDEEKVIVMTNSNDINPSWPKAVRGKQLFQQVINQVSGDETEESLAEKLLTTVLMDSKTFKIDEQPQDERDQGDYTAQLTASIFLPKNEVWHTRSSTVLIVDKANNATIIEWMHPTCQSTSNERVKTCVKVPRTLI